MTRKAGVQWANPTSSATPDAFFALVITLALFLPLTAADLYLSADRSGILPVNATYISFISVSFVFGTIFLAELACDRGRNLLSYYALAAPILFVLALLTIVQTCGAFLPSANSSYGGRYIYFALYSFVLYCFSVGIASFPAFRRYHRGILSVSLFGAAGSIFVNLAYPQIFLSNFLERGSGFEANPNHAAMIVGILAIATVDWTRSRCGDMFLWLFAGVAVAATLSRGGMILLMIAFLYYAAVTARLEPNRFRKNISVLLATIPGVVAVYFASNLGSTVYSSDNDRIRSLASLLGGDTTTVLHDSRVALVSEYIGLISERPIFGYGTGMVMSRAPGPHNMFLTLWLENGIFGLMAYLMVLVGCFWHFRKKGDSRGQAFSVALFVFSFFSHNLLNSSSRPIYVTLGLLSGMVVSVVGSKSAHSVATVGITGPFFEPTTGSSPSAPVVRGLSADFGRRFL